MNRKLVDDWFGAFHNKDITKLERALAPDFTHTSPFGRITGGQKYINIVKENAEAFFSPKIEIEDVIEGEDSFAVRYLVDGNPACDCIYVGDGRITKIFSYYHIGKKPTLYDNWLDN